MQRNAPSMLETHAKQLEELLAHPSVWRGRSRAAVETFPTGFAALDAGLPGGGWPRHGLVEILTPQPGVGELYLLLPALAALSRLTPARWCTWVSPPHEPFAPALAAHGVALDRMLIVRTHLPLWAHGAGAAFGRVRSGAGLAAARHRRAPSAGCSSRPSRDARSACCIAASGSRSEASPAMLRVLLEPMVEAGRHGARVSLLKSRGGSREPIDLTWAAAAA